MLSDRPIRCSNSSCCVEHMIESNSRTFNSNKMSSELRLTLIKQDCKIIMNKSKFLNDERKKRSVLYKKIRLSDAKMLSVILSPCSSESSLLEKLKLHPVDLACAESGTISAGFVVKRKHSWSKLIRWAFLSMDEFWREGWI